MSEYMVEPTAGQIRHYYSPPNAHKALIATGVSTTIIAAISVAMRIFTRTSVTKNGINMDDYMIMCALALSFVMLGLSLAHMHSGLGYHFWEVKTANYMVDFQVYTLAVTIVYATSLAFTKISILLFYLRLSLAKWFHILIWTLVAVVIIYAVVYDLISIFGCKPIAASWDLRLLPAAKCVDTLTKYMALSVLNIIIDVFTLVLPIPVVIPLQMSLRQKLSIILVFATGGLVCAIAIRRTTLLTPLLASTDYTWDAVEQYLWCYAEVNAAIVCASAPALKPFFVRYVPGLLNSKCGSSKHDEYSEQPHSRTLETISHKKSRKLGVKDVFELQSRDDVSEEGKTGDGWRVTQEDEARLWSGSSTEKGFVSAKITGDQGRRGDVEAGRISLQSEERRDRSKGIHVTSETRITYERN